MQKVKKRGADIYLPSQCSQGTDEKWDVIKASASVLCLHERNEIKKDEEMQGSTIVIYNFHTHSFAHIHTHIYNAATHSTTFSKSPFPSLSSLPLIFSSHLLMRAEFIYRMNFFIDILNLLSQDFLNKEIVIKKLQVKHFFIFCLKCFVRKILIDMQNIHLL